MASTIEYRHVAMKLDLREANAAQERLGGFSFEELRYYPREDEVPMVFVEHGSSNDWDEVRKRKPRSWSLAYYGHQAMSQVIRCSESCEGGMTQMKGRYTAPENYIKFYRDRMKNAVDLDLTCVPKMVFRFAEEYLNPTPAGPFEKRRMDEHPFTAYLRDRGALEVKDVKEYGTEKKVLELTLDSTDGDFLRASLAWVIDVAGRWGDAYHRRFSLNCWHLTSWIEAHLSGEQRALFEAA